MKSKQNRFYDFEAIITTRETRVFSSGTRRKSIHGVLLNLDACLQNISKLGTQDPIYSTKTFIFSRQSTGAIFLDFNHQSVCLGSPGLEHYITHQRPLSLAISWKTVGAPNKASKASTDYVYYFCDVGQKYVQKGEQIALFDDELETCKC